MQQRSIANEVSVVGIGLHSGEPITMVLKPANEDMGILFVRSDKGISIPLSPENVVDTRMATVIGKNGVIVSTIEHLLSAVSAFGIDNLEVHVDGEELPVLDGSSASFVMLLQEAGVQEQNARKKIMVLKKPVEVRDGDKFVTLRPSKKHQIIFEIKFNHPVIRAQKMSYTFSTKSYIKEIARARTFGFLKDLHMLQSMGKAKGASLDNTIGLDEKRVLNSEGLRFSDEFVRHKILDAIGDMALLGMPFFGTYESFAGSHHLNFKLTQAVLADKEAYEVVEVGSEAVKEMEFAFA
jgi:UDP-3-O-[3-hydroxymyristoyl] N-acetylglucosamine deacetylase